MDFDGEATIAFFGLHLKPGKPVSTAKHLQAGDPDTLVCLHVTQAALGHAAKPGRTSVVVVDASKEQFVVGTLEAGRCEQFSFELMLGNDISFLAQGSSDVYLTGWKTLSPLGPVGAFPPVDSDEDDEDDEDEEAPALVAAQAKALTAPKAKTNGLKQHNFPKLAGGIDPSEDDSEDEEDSDDDLDDEDDDMLGGAADGEELPPALEAKLKAMAKSAAEQNPLAGGLDDDDDDDDLDELEDSELDDDDDEDDDEDGLDAALPAVAAQAASKRPAAAAASAAAPNKKQKGAKGAAVPAAAPAPAAAAAPAAGKAKKEGAQQPDSAALKTYVASIKSYITQHGATRLSELGSKVKRPPGVSVKMGKAISDSGLFSVDSTSQNVSLK